MPLIKPLIFLLLLASMCACQQKNCTQSYPAFIIENGLEKIYDQAKLDWYLLNATDSYSKSDYLVVSDSIVLAGIHVRDSTNSFWIPDYQLLKNKQAMLARFGTDRVLEFLAMDIELFVNEEESIVREDTLTLTFFPQDNERGMVIDPQDGAIHTLIYVNGILKTVGQNDYIEYDVDSDEIERLHPSLKEKVMQAATATEWLKCKLITRFKP